MFPIVCFPAYFPRTITTSFSANQNHTVGRALQRDTRVPVRPGPGASASWCVMSCEKGEASTGSGNGVRRATHRSRGGRASPQTHNTG
eukprot:scaffold72266_cov53-Phaeocystis_antarctica.AAC.1